MVQNQESGAAGNKYGHMMGEKVAKFLGTKLLTKSSNEMILDGRRIIIKSARRKTPEIGISINMLERVDGIIAAIENGDGTYNLYQIETQWYKEKMTQSKSRSDLKGKINKVSCNAIRDECQIFDKMDSILNSDKIL